MRWLNFKLVGDIFCVSMNKILLFNDFVLLIKYGIEFELRQRYLIKVEMSKLQSYIKSFIFSSWIDWSNGDKIRTGFGRQVWNFIAKRNLSFLKISYMLPELGLIIMFNFETNPKIKYPLWMSFWKTETP